MRDFLADIVSHTQGVGINIVKINGDANGTTIESKSEDNSLILKGSFDKANAAFTGVFGMPDLGKLNTILNIPEYGEDAKINIVTQNRNGEDIPVGLHFENASGDFKNDYRFMTTEVINEKLKSVKFRGTNWNITFEPTVSNINRLKFQAAANKEESNFVVKTEGTDLKFYFGDASTHAGSFVFQGGISGKLTKEWSYNVGMFLSILHLQGDKTIQFSDDGVAQITVSSGLIKYEYLIPSRK